LQFRTKNVLKMYERVT